MLRRRLQTRQRDVSIHCVLLGVSDGRSSFSLRGPDANLSFHRSQSLLLPLPVPPTSLPSLYTAIEESVRPALAPAGRVLALVAANPHRELFERVWEKAKTDEPRKLLVVAWGRVMENFFGGEDGGEGRGEGSRGKGKDEKR